ncbi:MAG: site-specific DNA-methyltransferase [Bacteroidetes bacterium]|nr:site-specific DNA-methyltransferase [Bacteroidota bacterium]
MNQIEKFPLDSMNIKEEQISQLKQLFPEAFTEGNKIDWERLRLTLGENVDVGKERFVLNWAGKSECFKLIQQPSTGTLVPSREESINFDTTENLFIEGDNLEVLKLLQKSYFGKVKMIYIDPPYNTGNDFVYIDDFKDNLKNYLELTGQVDSEGKKLSTNVESDGRFHSNWLNMMYPRLFLAKNLLREDGVIFISIDDNEVHNLRALCNEIFGEENFVGTFIWKRRASSALAEMRVSSDHEYVICFQKGFLTTFKGNSKDYSFYKNPDNDPRGPWTLGDLTVGMTKDQRPNQFYDLIDPETNLVYSPNPNRVWAYIPSSMEVLIREKRVYFPKDSNRRPMAKRFKSELKAEVNPKSTLLEDVGMNSEGTRLIRDLLEANFFNYSKPLTLLTELIEQVASNEDIIIDFFAGSATTAHAVLNLNKEDGGNRKFICVQIPEPTDEASEAYKAGYKTIADIGKERIRRVIKKIEAEKEKQEPDMFEGEKKAQDLGFKVFKLRRSNFATWDANVEKNVDALTEQLFKNVDHISPAAEQEAILYELLLKAGFELTTEISKLTITDKIVYSVMDNALLICLERNLTHELLKAIAQLKPVRFICLDEGFRDNDQLKSNAVLLMKENGVQKFQTV